MTVIIQPDAEQFVLVGGGANLEVRAEDSLGADVQASTWQRASDPGGPFADLPGTAGDQFMPTNLTKADSGWYRAVFPDGNGGVIYSSSSHLLVGEAPTVTAPAGPATVLAGTQFSLSTTVGGDGPVDLVWESAPSVSGPWAALVGVTGNPVQVTAPATVGVTTYYRVSASSPFGDVSSDATSVKTYSGLAAPTSVSAVNNAPNQLVVSWVGGGASGIDYYFAVYVTHVETGDVFFQNVTSAGPATFTALNPGTYQVKVRTVSEAGNSDWVSPPATVTVNALVRNATLSARVIRPFVDGFQDTIVVKASSTFPASGVVRVKNSSGKLVRSYTLTSGTSWSVSYNGKSTSGALLPYGSYTVQAVVGGQQVLLQTITSTSSQVGSPSASWSPATVYPAKDGYYDSSTLSVKTSVPATVALVIKNSAGKTVYTRSLSRRMSASIAWTGRTSSGSVVPAGTYKAVITVKGGEGIAKVVSRSIAVSAKKLTPVSFSGSITAVNAYETTFSGSFDPNSDGSVGLWSSPYLGSDILGFSFDLPSSFGNRYANLKVYACGESSSYSGTAGMLRSDANWSSDYGGWGLGSDYACYGGSWDPSLLDGRRMYTIVGNVNEDSTFWWLDGFKVTGTRYVLK